MLTSKEEHYVQQTITALNKIGFHLKRLADLEQKKWDEDHHVYEFLEEDTNDTGRDQES